ncbi:MAG: hypothetical protein F6K58_32370 [Symploca sp. SIO2E9]|nr:hypothetical protein [Symploca sp. SIO2E9]
MRQQSLDTKGNCSQGVAQYLVAHNLPRDRGERKKSGGTSKQTLQTLQTLQTRRIEIPTKISLTLQIYTITITSKCPKNQTPQLNCHLTVLLKLILLRQLARNGSTTKCESKPTTLIMLALCNI